MYGENNIQQNIINIKKLLNNEILSEKEIEDIIKISKEYLIMDKSLLSLLKV